MHARKPPSDSVFARAVEARASGGSWEAVAKQVRRSAHTVRKWPRMYAERWASALRAAELAVIDSSAMESVHVLRELLRSKSDKVRVEAAWRLIYQRLEQCKIQQKPGGSIPLELSSDAHRIAAFAKEHSDEELDDLVSSLCVTQVSEGGNAVGGARPSAA